MKANESIFEEVQTEILADVATVLAHILFSLLNGIKISQNNQSPTLLCWQLLLSNIRYKAV